MNSLTTASKTVDRPIFIVGAGHSGTSILTRSLARHPDIQPWTENNKVWVWGNAFKDSDLLTEEDLNPKIIKHIRKKFADYTRESGKQRICDKTPKNCLRIPFILGVFPDAKIIHVVRDGRAVVSSTKSQINKKSYSFWRHLKIRLRGMSLTDLYVFLPRIGYVLRKSLGLPTEYWGSKPPGWEEWAEQLPPNAMLAKQWSETVSIAMKQGRAVSSANYLEVHYEDFISNHRQVIEQIADFAEIENPQPIIEFCDAKIDPTRNKKRIKSLSEDNSLDLITQIIEPTLVQLGYK